MIQILKKIWPDIAAVAFFAAISIIFMFPAMQGKTINQHDAVAGIGAGQEVSDYYAQTGERSRWTNSLFGGMPTFQQSPSYPANTILNKVESIYHLFLPKYVWYLFALLLGFFILMRTLKQNVLISVLGAVFWAFSSYFIIIISAGHLWKVMTLAYIPPTIAGMILIYRRKYFLGFAVTALFASLQLMSNHVQMTYYFLFVMLGIFIALAIEAVKSKEVKQFIYSTAILIAAGLVAVCVNSSNLYHTYQYSKETIRGGAELVDENDTKKQTKGLDRDYITAWSYGIGETFTLLVPNAKGGATSRGDELMTMSKNKAASSVADKNYKNIYQQMTQYWGDQPMTAGPVYVGAFVCLLFVLGLFLVKGARKWTLLALTILSILLAWGRNFQWFTDIFIDHMPMYSKFRTVSSILVIAEFTIPLLGILGLSEFLKQSYEGKDVKKPLIYSFGITGGLCLLFAVAPSILGPVIRGDEMAAIQDLANRFVQAGSSFPVDDFFDNLTAMRHKMLSADAMRSFVFILLGTIILFLISSKKLRSQYGVALLVIVSLVDLWGVDRRYQTLDMFQRAPKSEKMFVKTDADNSILADPAIDYRVLNFTTNTFNENNTSYFHKSIGGYHAAKLRRYQDIIDRHIVPEMSIFTQTIETKNLHVLNMLNTRHFILPYNGTEIDYPNGNAYGNAWFVDSLVYVNDANEEIDALSAYDPKTTAIVDKSFSDELGSLQEGTLGTAVNSDIKLLKYAPNKLEYETTSESGGIAVLSEVYYPGWRAYVDGEQIAVGRADYILRAVNIPSGNHSLVLTFDPVSLHVTNTISFIGLALLLISFIIGVGKSVVLEIRNSEQQ